MSSKPPRPAGTGRRARRRRRQQARERGELSLLAAPWLHGNTAPGRLSLLDAALGLIGAPLFPPALGAEAEGADGEFSGGGSDQLRIFGRSNAAGGDSAFVDVAFDVGVGDDPATTEELASALSGGGCSRVIGTDVDERRVAEAAARRGGDRDGEFVAPSPLGTPEVEYRLGGADFVLPLRPDERPALVRAMNVLRDYHVRDAAAALHQLAAQLDRTGDGGLLVEGSCSAVGDVLVALVVAVHATAAAACVDRTVGVGGRLGVDAVVFAADLGAMDRSLREGGGGDGDNDGGGSCMLPLLGWSPPVWFRRQLPRIWRGCCAEEEEIRGGGGCVSEEATFHRDVDPSSRLVEREEDNNAHPRRRRRPMPWADPLRNFLAAWECVSAEVVTSSPQLPELVAKDVFVRSSRTLAERMEGATTSALNRAGPAGSTPSVIMDWAEHGILIWRPGVDAAGRPVLTVPYPEETIR